MDIKGFFDPVTATITYLIADPATKRAAIIDPVLDYELESGTLSSGTVDAVLKEAETRDLKIDWVLDTHAHADHLSAADYIRKQTGARYGIGAKITEVQKVFKPVFNAVDLIPDGQVFDHLFEDGETFKIGDLEARVMSTPGHTPACLTFVIGDAAFIGDTMFMPDYGTARSDFPGGSSTDLYRSIRKILELPEDTRVFVGHDYLPDGRDEIAWEATIGEQRASNVHARDGVSEADFVAVREKRNATLAPPRLILPSLQVNIRAGALPPAEDDGKVYLKTPVKQA